MNDALVSAQQLREDMRTQSSREAELMLREARLEADRIVAEAQGQATAAEESARRIQAQRVWFLRAFRAFVERQLGEIEQEEERLRELLRVEGEHTTEAFSSEEDAAAIQTPLWLSAMETEPSEG